MAQQPLASFAGACFHTNLMRGIELANAAYSAVSADIASRAPGQPSGGYYRYTNKRFMFSLDIPDGYTAGSLPVDRDGKSFTNSAGTATVTASGSNNTPNWTPSQDLASLVSAYQSDGDDVTLDYLNGDVIAVSGTTPSGAIFYERDIVYPAVIYALAWTYPTADKAQYNALVSHTVSSFTPGPDHGD